MSQTITITTQERYLLDLIATAESGPFGYTAYYPSSTDPTIVEKTLQQILAFQQERISSGIKSSAIGRYQFIKKTLESAINIAGLDTARTRFTAEIQDYLILAVLKNSRGLNRWVDGTLSSADFQLNLAREFASVPVPYDTQGANRFVRKGECYYAGDGLNAAGHKADCFIQSLDDILAGGPGELRNYDVATTGPNGSYPPEGNSNRRIAETATAGGQRVTGGRQTTTDPSSQIRLPTPKNVYLYRPIDAHDNRYDFRTGQMIRDIGINGTNPISANPNYTRSATTDNSSTQTPGVSAGPDVGASRTETFTTSTDASATVTANQVGYGQGQVDPTIARAAGLNVVPTPSSTPEGVSGVSSRPPGDTNRLGPQ